MIFIQLLLFFWLPLSASQGISSHHYQLEDKTLVHLVEIDPDYFNIIVKEAKDEPAETVEKIAKREQAAAAINGGFFYTSGEWRFQPCGVLKIGENWRGHAFLPRGAIGWSNGDSHVLFDRLLTKIEKNGWVTILPQSPYTSGYEWENAFYILGGTPLLIQNGDLIRDFKEEKTILSFLTEKHPRSAIGVLPNGHFLFVTVDGTRNFFFKNSGITMSHLALLMQELGCRNALNLDGGGSSTLYFDGTIQNRPCGECLDENGFFTRKVPNAILALPK